MRSRPALVAALVLVLLLLAAALPLTAAAAGWSPQDSGTTQNLHGVSFVDADHGWAVGDNGTIIATANGGATWNAQSSGTTERLNAVSFPDALHGWAVGLGGTIVTTADGGAHWSAQSAGTTETLRGVSFPDADHGWAVGTRGTVRMTADGGAHWSAQDLHWANDLNAVQFLDAAHGWAAGANGKIPFTANGGAYWGRATLSQESSTTFYGISVPDATHGWAVGMRGAIVSSGQGWWSRQITRVSVPLFAVSFPDTTNGWVVGYGGTVLGTSDGGLQWSSQPSGAHEHLFAVAFPDTVHGWAVGNRGTVIATTTGGWPAETCTVTPSLVGGHGSISPSTPQEYEAGATPTFSFTPEAGYYVSQVLVDGEPVALTAPGSYTFEPLTGDRTISVSFTQGVCAVTALATTSGGTVSPLGTTWVPFFGALTVSVTPAAHYHTDRVTIDGAAVGVQPSYTFVNVSARHRLEAAFALDRYAVTPNVVRLADGRPHGQISPALAGTFPYGATPTYRFTPESGYAVFEVRVDGVQVLPTPRTSYTFAPLAGPHTISVRFVQGYVPAVQ